MIATYRLQLTPEQDFAAVRELVPYLCELGVSHLYLSPVLQARSGSTHGYDVVDPTRISAALGGEDGLRELAAAGLKLVLDVVPNHMGAGDENRWWADERERPRVFDYDPTDGWYRRFFDIDDLAAVRVEDPEVFALTHGKVLELVADGVVDGLRVDHPDGLADPAGYLRRLRDAGVQRVWVEKILATDEQLREWPVAGTVGYEFLNDACALFVDPGGEATLTALAAEITGEARGFAAIARDARREQATSTFVRELERLRALAPDGVEEAELAAALAAMPVYRTYVEPATGCVDPADRAAIAAVGAAPRLGAALLLEDPGFDELAVRFQQTSPAVVAKGTEDTAFYRDLRLLALNEVGGDPARFGLSVDAWHARCAARAARWPQGLLVTQTHDAKRSADVRARIGALAGMANAWEAAVRHWRECYAALPAPDGHVEYLVLQTLAGAWPMSYARLREYLIKALREAKLRTSWAAPDEAYERAATGWLRVLLDHEPFLVAFRPFCARVVVEGARTALGQVLLKLTSPGVPDVYQGDELEDRSLVDPDNRRPVDWDARRAALARLRGGEPPRDHGERKLDLIRRTLALRGRRPAAFDHGAYEPLDAGPGICAYLRGGEVLAVVPVRGVAGARLPALQGAWVDVLADGAPVKLGGGVAVGGLLRDGWPVALLERA